MGVRRKNIIEIQMLATNEVKPQNALINLYNCKS
jgi:hypothetical protein